MDNYERALKHFQAGKWDKLGQNLYIPDNWWDTISEGICQTDEFYEVVTERDDHSVFEELDNQLTTLSQYTPDPAPYTDQEAVQNVRGPSFDDWNHRCTVRLSYDIAVEENEEEDDDEEEEDRWRIYTWGIYQKRGTAQYAIMVEPTYWKARQYHDRKYWKKLAYALNIEDEWNYKVEKWLKKCIYFGQALKEMEQREARGDQIHTKVGEIFSQLRELKVDDDDEEEEEKLEAIATIILKCETLGTRYRVHFWSLKGSRKASTHSIEENNIFRNSVVKEVSRVYMTANMFYKERYWAGLRNLLDIDINWWNRVLKKLCQSRLFGEILLKLETSERRQSIYPLFNNIFSWTRVPECKPEDVKVIIVGQDPVPDDKATGISFLFEPETEECPAIRNVFVAARFSNSKYWHSTITHNCPYSWCTQGVLLLNTYMTIGDGNNNRHDGFGWERMTNRILEYFVDNTVDRKLHILLWYAYWNKGTPSHMERLSERAIGDNVELILTHHPTARSGNFHMQAPLVFKHVRTIRWETIFEADYPIIPAGVIHPTPPKCSIYS